MSEREYTILWQATRPAGLEHCHVRGTRSGWSFDGVLLGALDEQPLRITYRISCDRFWRVGMVNVTRWLGRDERTLRIGLAPTGEWVDYLAGSDLSHLAGCTDVDLAFSPITNTLAIRRLNLAVGQSAEIRAAWVRFPSLAVEPLAQRYERLSEARYRYESSTGYRTELEVDSFGLVVNYPGLWQRVALAGGVGG